MNIFNRAVGWTRRNLNRKYRNYTGGERQSVMMLHHGRSGSTVLTQMLQQHSDLHWDGEFFHPLSNRSLSDSKLKKWSNPLEVLQNRPDFWQGFVYGLEVKFKHIWEPRVLNMSVKEFVDAMHEMGIEHWIVLKRSHYLRMMLSCIRGMKTGSWHSKKGESNEARTLSIDLEKANVGLGESRPVLEQFHRLDETFEEIKELLQDRKTLWLEYESDIFNDPKVAYLKTCEFLNIKPLHIEPTLQKSAFKPVCDLIANFDELSSVLENTPYEWMLEIDKKQTP